MDIATTQAETAFLEKLVGTWIYDTSEDVTNAEATDCKPPTRWTETVRALGGRWFIAESEMDFGGISRMLMTLGYNAKTGVVDGTWVGSEGDTMYIYKGFLDNDGRRLVLEAEGPDFSDPEKTAVYRDVITWIDDDTREFAGTIRQEDGTFRTFMSSTCRRNT